MKKLLFLLVVMSLLSCKDSRQSERPDDANKTEMLDESSGEDITPQLVPDDSLEDTRYDVDTIRSAEGADRQSDRDSVD